MKLLRLKRSGQPEPLTAIAADWVLRSERGLNKVDEAKLKQWLAKAEHANAFDDAIWALDTVQSHAGSPELLSIREAALAKAPKRSALPGIAAKSALAAAAAAVLLWVGLGSRPPEQELDRGPTIAEIAPPERGFYKTGIGERSAVVLPDGSIATLDTDSQLRVAYSASKRAIVLLKGQALFEVAKSKSLPFEVYARTQRITAVGTTFNVRLKDDQVQVSMIEGVVKVRRLKNGSTDGAPVQELTLRSGESLVAEPNNAASITHIDTQRVAPWRGGLLVFDDDRLSDAIAEVNRYTDKPIRIADASVGEYRVTGVFKTKDPARFARAMSEVFPIQVERSADGSQTLKAPR